MSEFEASLVYRESSRTVLKNKQTKTKTGKKKEEKQSGFERVFPEFLKESNKGVCL